MDAKRNAVAVAKIELGEIAVQVLLAAMLVDALHPAFEDREEALDGVGRGDAAILGLADIFFVADD